MKVKLILKSGREIKLSPSEVRELYDELGLIFPLTWTSVPTSWELEDPQQPNTTTEWEAITVGGTL